MTFAVGLAAALVAYHNAVAPFLPRPLRLPVTLAAAAAAVAAGRRRGLSWKELGLGREGVRPGLRWGLGVAGPAAAALGLLLVLPGGERLLRERRLAGLGTGEILYRTLVRIPLETALAEEVAFRGALHGAFARERSPLAAVVGSSVAFGLWHVAPTLALLEANRPGLGLAGRALGVAGAVAATTIGGALFGALRLRTRGVVGPWIAHWALNALGTVAAVVAQR